MNKQRHVLFLDDEINLLTVPLERLSPMNPVDVYISKTRVRVNLTRFEHLDVLRLTSTCDFAERWNTKENNRRVRLVKRIADMLSIVDVDEIMLVDKIIASMTPRVDVDPIMLFDREKIFPYTPEGEIAAARQYNEWAIELHGPFAVLNDV